MLSCKEVVKNISSDERTTWRRKLGVRLHLLICLHCRKYAKQLEILRSSISKLLSAKSQIVDEKKVREIEDRVIEKVQN